MRHKVHFNGDHVSFDDVTGVFQCETSTGMDTVLADIWKQGFQIEVS